MPNITKTAKREKLRNRRASLQEKLIELEGEIEKSRRLDKFPDYSGYKTYFTGLKCQRDNIIKKLTAINHKIIKFERRD